MRFCRYIPALFVLHSLLLSAAVGQSRGTLDTNVPDRIVFAGMFQSDSDVDSPRTPCQKLRDVFDHSGRAHDLNGERPAFCDKIVDVIAGKADPSLEDVKPGLRGAKIATDSHGRIVLAEPGTQTIHIFDFANRKYLRI